MGFTIYAAAPFPLPLLPTFVTTTSFFASNCPLSALTTTVSPGTTFPQRHPYCVTFNEVIGTARRLDLRLGFKPAPLPFRSLDVRGCQFPAVGLPLASRDAALNKAAKLLDVKTLARAVDFGFLRGGALPRPHNTNSHEKLAFTSRSNPPWLGDSIQITIRQYRHR